MRPDQRHNAAPRPLVIHPHYTTHAWGSVLVELGQTKVIVTVSIEDRVPSFCRGTHQGWMTAEYAMLPGATHQRNPRESIKGRPSGRSSEIQRLIGRSLRPVLDLSLLGERTVIIDCDVIQADGGTRTASITGAMAALRLAFGKWVLAGSNRRSPIRDWVAAISVGIVDGECRCDLCYEEDANASVDMNVVMNEAGNLIELQGTAESSPFGDSELTQMIGMARGAIVPMIQTIKQLPLS